MAIAFIPDKLTSTSTTKDFALGTTVNVGGNTYIYLQGITSTAQYDWVTYDSNYLTARLVANAKGPVAIAQSACVADNYGWYLRTGVGYGNSLQVATGAVAYACGTTGLVDDATTTGDYIIGAYAGASGGTGSPYFIVDCPKITDGLV